MTGPYRLMDPRSSIPIESRVLTVEEATKAARSGTRFLKEALQTGILLVGDENSIKN